MHDETMSNPTNGNMMKCTGYESPIGMSRRKLLGQFGMGLGSMALASLSGQDTIAAPLAGSMPTLHNFGQAKRVIYLFQAGGPSQLELFDHKPLLR